MNYQGYYHYLLKEPIFFSGTVQDNLMSSQFNCDVSEEYVILLLKLLGAANFLEVVKPERDSMAQEADQNIIPQANSKSKKLKIELPTILKAKKQSSSELSTAIEVETIPDIKNNAYKSQLFRRISCVFSRDMKFRDKYSYLQHDKKNNLSSKPRLE